MGRVKFEKLDVSGTHTLDELIPAYVENKTMLDDYKKICDSENKKIKELMQDTDTYEVAGYKATKSVQVRETMNEYKLLDVLRNVDGAKENKLIKTQEYVDMDILESMIYAGAISKDILMEIDKCRETKEIVTLRVSKVKENKE